MSAILIVGPSRVGKTTLARNVSNHLGAKHLDLDIEAKVREPGYMERAKQIILNSIADEDVLYILDFGAGFQNTPESFNFFVPYKDNMISVLNDVVNVHSRHNGRDFDEFAHTEFREDRRKIYELSKYKIKTSSNIELDTKLMYSHINKIIS
jgi:AAA+ ATPase superfamily predicted ATPase